MGSQTQQNDGKHKEKAGKKIMSPREREGEREIGERYRRERDRRER
jgi:hypothetical protein